MIFNKYKYKAFKRETRILRHEGENLSVVCAISLMPSASRCYSWIVERLLPRYADETLLWAFIEWHDLSADYSRSFSPSLFFAYLSRNMHGNGITLSDKSFRSNRSKVLPCFYWRVMLHLFVREPVPCDCSSTNAWNILKETSLIGSISDAWGSCVLREKRQYPISGPFHRSLPSGPFPITTGDRCSGKTFLGNVRACSYRNLHRNNVRKYVKRARNCRKGKKRKQRHASRASET